MHGRRPAVDVLGATGAAPLGARVEALGGVVAEGAVRQQGPALQVQRWKMMQDLRMSSTASSTKHYIFDYFGPNIRLFD